VDLTGFGMVIPLLPFYVTTFQAGPTALGVLLTSFSIMQFVFAPILGRISDKVGRRPVLLLSILTSVVSFILFALANSYLILLLSRIIAGLATEAAVAQAYIADITDEKERAEKMGKVGAAVGAGFIFGPAIGGFLSAYGFAATGFGAAALAFCNLLFVFFFLPESMRKKQSERSLTVNHKRNFFRNIWQALTKPLVGPVFVISFIITYAFSAIQVIVPLLTVSFFNFGSSELSYIFIYIGTIQIVLQGLILGRLVKKVGEEKLLAFGPLVMMVGVVAMPLIPNIGLFLFTVALMAFGNGVMQTVVPSFISKRTAKSEQGSMLGIAQSVSSIARVPGPIIGGFVVEITGLASSFFLSGLFLMVAFIVSCRVFQACTLKKK
jgi:multidrug resistance protein